MRYVIPISGAVIVLVIIFLFAFGFSLEYLQYWLDKVIP